MSVSKIHAGSSDVTMITEDGVIAEMIIEVDDENDPPVPHPFDFDMDEDDDCVEIFSDFGAPKNQLVSSSTTSEWTYNGSALFGVKNANHQKEVNPGLCNLNLLEESGSKNMATTVGVIASNEDAEDCIVVDEAFKQAPKKKYTKRLPPPKSDMVTRRKAATTQLSKTIPKETSENVPLELNSEKESDSTLKENKSGAVPSLASDVANRMSEPNKLNAPPEKMSDNKDSELNKMNGQTSQISDNGGSKPDTISVQANQISENKDSELNKVNGQTNQASDNRCSEPDKMNDQTDQISDNKGSEPSKMNDPEDQMKDDKDGSESSEEHNEISGRGEKLEDISFISQIIENYSKRLGLRWLYKFTYSHRIPKDMEMIKDRLLQFNGFPFEETSVDYLRKMKALATFPETAIRQMCFLLAIPSGTKDDMVHNILKFLLKPENVQISPFSDACYQPKVRLERLSEGIIKSKSIERKVLERMELCKKETPAKKIRKKKAAIESSEVRLTRSAKRLMEHSEDKVSEKDTLEKEKLPKFKGQRVGKKTSLSDKDTSSGSSKERRKVKVENISEECENTVSSANSKNEVEWRDSLFTYNDNFEDDTEEDSDYQELVNAECLNESDKKGTLGRRLRDFKDIRQSIQKCDTICLQKLHSILYEKHDKPENWKRNILRFSGFNFKCVSSKWRRKEFVLSLMSVDKLREIADLLHLQYYSPRSQKSLTFSIMKFLSEPREGLLKSSSKYSYKRGERYKPPNSSKTRNKQALAKLKFESDETPLEIEALLKEIRRKRVNMEENSSAENGLATKSVFAGSKKRKLGDIPNVQFMIITSNYEDIDNLHQLLFLQSGPRAKIRRNVQNFDGFTFGPSSFCYKIRIKLLNKMGYEVAKRIAFFLGLAPRGTTIPQQDLNELIMHFLMCPSEIKCKSIKAYPKNFFNNCPTKRPVVDISSIRNAVLNKKLKTEDEEVKDEKDKVKKSASVKRTAESSISEDIHKKIKKEVEDVIESQESVNSYSDPLEEPPAEKITTNNNQDDITSSQGGGEKSIANHIKKVNMRGKRQRQRIVSALNPKPVQKKKAFTKKKESLPAAGRKKKTVLKKENEQLGNDVKKNADDAAKEQFLFRFDPTNKLDSKKLLDYLNKESQKSAMPNDTKTEIKDCAQTNPPNTATAKVLPKTELHGLPKIISILLPPPSSSSTTTSSSSSSSSLLRNFSVSYSQNSQLNSGLPRMDSVPTFNKNIKISTPSATSDFEEKLPLPQILKKPVLMTTIPQSTHPVRQVVPSSHVTQIRVPPNFMESMKGSQIEGVIRLPQNFLLGQKNVSMSASGVANEILALPQVQKCLSHINSSSVTNAHVKMLKTTANNPVPIQPSLLNLGGGKYYIIPMKPSGQPLITALPVSTAGSPIQVNNQIMVTSSSDSGNCKNSVTIPQIIKAAKNYSRTAGTTALPFNTVTIPKIKQETCSTTTFPVMSSRCAFPVNISQNSNIGPISIVKIQHTSEKEPSQTEACIIKTEKVEAEKSELTPGSTLQKDDGNSDSELDEEPLSHLVGHPSDEMLLQNVREIVVGADLSSITMRNVFQKIFDKYPKFDLNYRKSFLKEAVKKVVCFSPHLKTA